MAKVRHDVARASVAEADRVAAATKAERDATDARLHASQAHAYLVRAETHPLPGSDDKGATDDGEHVSMASDGSHLQMP